MQTILYEAEPFEIQRLFYVSVHDVFTGSRLKTYEVASATPYSAMAELRAEVGVPHTVCYLVAGTRRPE